MRIAFAIIECNKQGGQDQYVFELINNLLLQGHEISLYTNRLVGEFALPITIHHIPVLGKINLLRFASFFLFATLALWRATTPYDIIHSAGGNMLGANVITAHYCHPAWQSIKASFPALQEQGWRYYYEALVSKLGDLFDRMAYHSKKRPLVIAVSTHTKADLMQYYHLTADRIKIIYNGVNTIRFHPAQREKWRTQVRDDYGIAPHTLLLLFVGAFARKGLATTIEALHYLSPEIRLMVVGSGDKQHYQTLATTQGVAERIIWTGAVQEIERLYSAADIFLLPTYYEPFGLVITEAMASGLAVITSRCAGAAEIIEHQVDGWLLDDPSDAQSMAMAVTELNTADTLHIMGIKARAKACHYNWSTITRQTEVVYEMVLAKNDGKI